MTCQKSTNEPVGIDRRTLVEELVRDLKSVCEDEVNPSHGNAYNVGSYVGVLISLDASTSMDITDHV